MSISPLTDADSEAAQKYWHEYEASHDLSERIGQTAGIDPGTGRIWFGNSIQEIVHQMDALTEFVPLLFVRVGSDTYWSKGSNR